MAFILNSIHTYSSRKIRPKAIGGIRGPTGESRRQGLISPLIRSSGVYKLLVTQCKGTKRLQSRFEGTI